MALLYSYWHRMPITKILYFLITVVGTWLFFFFTVMVNMSKFTSDDIEQLFRENVSFLKLPCTIQNKIQKLESNLLKPCL
jgi:hypothetical protein